jgi:hypothetical protein
VPSFTSRPITDLLVENIYMEVGDGFDPESATESVGPTTLFFY